MGKDREMLGEERGRGRTFEYLVRFMLDLKATELRTRQ